MSVKARVVHLRNLFGKQLHPLRTLAEDYRLVDVKLLEQCVQAVQLLTLLKICVVLSDTLQRQLVHKVDENWIRYVAFLECLDLLGESSRIEHELLVCLGHLADYLSDDLLEV